MPRSSTPADPTTLATAGRAMLPSAQKTASAPRSVPFRGSITRPAHSLCTLRSRGRPRTTQHSVPAGAYPLPGQDFHVLGSSRSRKFPSCLTCYMASPFSRLCLAQSPRERGTQFEHSAQAAGGPVWPSPGRGARRTSQGLPCLGRSQSRLTRDEPSSAGVTDQPSAATTGPRAVAGHRARRRGGRRHSEARL